jgi:hypothetical protein
MRFDTQGPKESEAVTRLIRLIRFIWVIGLVGFSGSHDPRGVWDSPAEGGVVPWSTHILSMGLPMLPKFAVVADGEVHIVVPMSRQHQGREPRYR